MWAIFRRALDTDRGHWGRIALVAAIALLPAAVLQGILASLADDVIDKHPVLFAILTIAAIGAGAFGYFFLSGALAQLTVVRRRGGPMPALGELAKSIPYGQLILADAIISIGTAIGLALLIIPGIVFATLFGLAPVLIEVRHLGAVAGMRRSAELVRPAFWWVLAVLAIAFGLVYALAIPIELAVDGFTPGGDDIDEILAAYLAGVAVKPFAALVTVELALDLDEQPDVARRRQPP